MLHTMNAGYMARVCNNFIKAHTVVGSNNPDSGFIQKLAEKAAEKEHVKKAENTSETDNSPGISVKDMTMEEYQQYIYGKISRLPMHPSNMSDYVSVQISDAGFEAMKNDSEYEQWVLDSIKSSFTARDPWSGMCGGKYVLLSFGASKEQSRGESFRAGFMNGRENKIFNQKSKDGFWERRAERMEEQMERAKQLQEIKELNRRMDQGLYFGPLPILDLLVRPSKGGAAE